MKDRNRIDNRQQTNSKQPKSFVQVLVLSLFGIGFLITIILLPSQGQWEQAMGTTLDRDSLGLHQGSLGSEFEPIDNTPVPKGSVQVSNENAEIPPDGQPLHRVVGSNYSRSSDERGRPENRGQRDEAQSMRYGHTIVVPLFPIFLMNLILVAILWDTVRKVLEVAKVRSDRS